MSAEKRDQIKQSEIDLLRQINFNIRELSEYDFEGYYRLSQALGTDFASKILEIPVSTSN